MVDGHDLQVDLLNMLWIACQEIKQYRETGSSCVTVEINQLLALLQVICEKILTFQPRREWQYHHLASDGGYYHVRGLNDPQ